MSNRIRGLVDDFWAATARPSRSRIECESVREIEELLAALETKRALIVVRRTVPMKHVELGHDGQVVRVTETAGGGLLWLVSRHSRVDITHLCTNTCGCAEGAGDPIRRAVASADRWGEGLIAWGDRRGRWYGSPAPAHESRGTAEIAQGEQ